MCMVYLDENIREKKSILIKMTQVNRNREKKNDDQLGLGEQSRW